MALKKTGVQLVADDANDFLRSIGLADKAIAEFGQSAVDSAKDLKKLESAVKAALKIEALTDKLKIQTSQLKVLEQELSQVSAKYGESSVQAQKKRIAIDKLTSSIHQTEASLDQTRAALDAYKQGMTSAGRITEDAADKASRAGGKFEQAFSFAAGHLIAEGIERIGGALTGLIGKMIELGSSFETTLNVFAQTSQATGEQMEQVSAKARELGADLSLPGTSATDAAEAMLELSKAGLSVNDILAASKGVLSLSAAGQLSNAEAAEIAANALNAFHLEGSKAVMVSDLLAAAANASSLDVRDVADGFNQASAIFYEFQKPAIGAENAMIELTTALAIMANAGIKGSDAGTSVKTMLLKLAGPTDEAKGLMTELAASIGESGNLAYTSEGRMRSFRDIIQLTARATRNLSEETRNEAINTIFGSDAARAALILMGSTSDQAVELGQDYDTLRGKVTQVNAANDMAAARMKGLGGAIEAAKSGFETFLLEAITPWIPLLTRAAQGAGAFVDMLGPMIDLSADLAKAVADVISHIEDFIPLLIGVGAALTAKVIPGILASTAALIANTGALTANAFASLKSIAGYGLIVVAVGGVVKAYTELKDKIKAATEELLRSRPGWKESEELITQFGDSTEAVARGTQIQIDELKRLRDEQKRNIDLQAKLLLKNEGFLGGLNSFASSLGSGMGLEERMEKLRGVFKENEQAILDLNKKIQDQALINQDASAKAEAHGETWGRFAERQKGAIQSEQAMTQAVKATEDQLKDAQDTIAEIMSKGGGVLSEVVMTETAFRGEIETLETEHKDKMRELRDEYNNETNTKQREAIAERIKDEEKGYQEQFNIASTAYANEKAAQRAHLGQMLIDYINAQAVIFPERRKKSGELITAITQEYGIQASLSDQLFAGMLTDIDNYTTSASDDIGSLIGRLREAETTMGEAQQATATLSNDYITNLTKKFQEGKIGIDEFIAGLAAIPPKVTTEVNTKYTQTGTPPQNIVSGTRVIENAYTPGATTKPGGPKAGVARAKGGPFSSGVPMLVGEKGPEMIMPRTPGFVMNNAILRKFAASAQQANFNSGQRNKTTVQEYLAKHGIDASIFASRDSWSGASDKEFEALVKKGLALPSTDRFDRQISRAGQFIEQAIKTNDLSLAQQGMREAKGVTSQNDTGSFGSMGRVLGQSSMGSVRPPAATRSGSGHITVNASAVVNVSGANLDANQVADIAVTKMTGVLNSSLDKLILRG